MTTETNVATLPLPERKTRTHISPPLEPLAELVAMVYERGYKDGMEGKTIMQIMEGLVTLEASHAHRVRLYLAKLQAEYG